MLTRQEELGRGDLIGPLDWLKILPHETAASSDRLGWVGLEAARCRAAPAFELDLPALTHHRLFLFTRPPEELDLRCEGVTRDARQSAGSISGRLAGNTSGVRWCVYRDGRHSFHERG